MFSYLYSRTLHNAVHDSIILNVHNIIRNEYSNFFVDIFDYNLMFRKTLFFDRSNDKKFIDILNFTRYYKRSVTRINKMVDQMKQYDNIYFFSDKEFIIEIMIRMIKEKGKGKNVYLIDEGRASKVLKADKKYAYKRMLKSIIIKLFRYKYLGNHVIYGQSNLFDCFLTQYAVNYIKNISSSKIKVIQKLNFKDGQVAIKQNIDIGHTQSAIYISSALSESKLISYSKEKNIISQLKQLLQKENVDMYIKLHPVEDNTKFTEIIDHDKFINKYIPSECITDGFDIIITANSSSIDNIIGNDVIIVILAKLFQVDWEERLDNINLNMFLLNDISEIIDVIRGCNHEKKEF